MKEKDFTLEWWRRIHSTACETKAISPELTLEMLLNDIQNYIDHLERNRAN